MMSDQTPNVDSIYPLSPMQQGMLFETLRASDRGVYSVQRVITLSGQLQPLAMREAWEIVTQRHPPLRTLFLWNNVEKPLQVVRRQVELPWQCQDWREFSDSEQQAKIEEVLLADRHDGFDFSRAPLMRLRLIRLAEDRHVLIWHLHHLLLDGWSGYLVFDEVMRLYEGICEGQDVTLEPRRPYLEYVKWLNQQDLPKTEAFWREALAGFTAPTPFGVDRNGKQPFGPVREVREQEIEFSADSTARLRSFCRQQNLTLGTLMQAGWALLLNRYSGHDDVLFGSVVSGRPAEMAGAESMIGMFINTLPVRARFEAESSLSTSLWLKSFQSQLAEMRQFEHSPLVDVQRWSEVPRGLSLFESVFDFVNYPVSPSARQRRSGLQPINVRSIEKTNYPLTVIVVPRGNLTVRVAYDIQRFDGETILQMLAHYQRLLEGVVTNPEQRLSDLPMLTETERQRVLVDWNNTGADYPRGKCIHELFEEQVASAPAAVAVVFGDQQLTYQELNRRANQLADRLLACGVEPDRLVGICMDRSVEMVIGLLAILKAGGAYVPLDPTYPTERLLFMLRDTRPAIVLTQAKLRQRLPPDVSILCLDTEWHRITEASNRNPDIEVNAENLAYVIYTSGSTGQPKGVEVVHRGVIRLVRGTDYARFSPSETFLQLAPLAFDASTFEIWGALLNGAKLVLMPPEQPTLKEIGMAIRAQKVTTLWLTAGLFHLMVEERITDLKPLRQLLAGGDVLSIAHVRQVRQQLTDCRLINGYGPTESTTFTCCYGVGPQTNWERSIPIGRPIANTEVFILDRHLQPVPVGVPGELYIGGDGLARGYLHRADLTAEKFVPNPFSSEPGARLYKTGDLARYLADGNVEFLGRLDKQVKVRGFRVEPGEIEAVLQQHKAVRQCVVLARRDIGGDMKLVAYVVPETTSDQISTELRAHLRDRLPDYMVPAAFVVLDSFPLTANGKIDREALPAPDQSRAQTQAADVPPRTPTEEALVGIWCDVLGLKKIGIHDNFFDLGGHSLLAVRLQARLEKELGRKVPLAAFFQAPTVLELAQLVQRNDSMDCHVQLMTPLVPGQKPALFCLHFLSAAQNLGKYLGSSRPVYGLETPLDEEFREWQEHGKIVVSVEELAAVHLARIKTVQPRGPYYLTGFCFGGVLAFEVASQLTQQGEKVAFLALVDAFYVPGRVPRYSPALTLKRLSYHSSKIIWEGAHYITQKIRERANAQKRQAERGISNMPAFFAQIIKPYRAKPYPGDIILFKSTQTPLFNSFVWGQSNGWDKVAQGRIHVEDARGDHSQLAEDPYAGEVVRSLQLHLSNSQV